MPGGLGFVIAHDQERIFKVITAEYDKVFVGFGAVSVGASSAASTA